MSSLSAATSLPLVFWSLDQKTIQLEDGCCVFFPPRREEGELGYEPQLYKTSHLEVARSPVSYTYKCRTCGTIRTSKHSAVRCCCFIGSRATGGTGDGYTYIVTKRLAGALVRMRRWWQEQNCLRSTHTTYWWKCRRKRCHYTTVFKNILGFYRHRTAPKNIGMHYRYVPTVPVPYLPTVITKKDHSTVP